MNIGSPFFLGFLLISLLIFHGVTRVPRSLITLAINGIFIASFFDNPLAIAPTLGFVVMGWLSVHLVARIRVDLTVPVAILCLLAWFMITKQYAVVPDHLRFDFPYSAIGLSYLLFRILHLLIDVRQGAITQIPGPVAYINYLFCFLTFVAGPIQRYEDHLRFTSNQSEILNRQQVRDAIVRIIDGFIKVGAIAVVAYDIMLSLPISIVSDSTSTQSILYNLPISFAMWFYGSDGEPLVRLSLRLVLHGFAFLAYLYINFSGYMDIVIGSARLFGYQLPENFNRPLISRNMLDFWSRWHITLSDWFKIYVFQPLLKTLAVKFGRRKASGYLVVPAYMATFLLMGIWHGTTVAFLYYGIMLGAGAAGNKLFQLLSQAALGKKNYANIAKNPVYAALAQGATIAYFGISLWCLWLDADQLAAIVQLYGVNGLIRLTLVAILTTTLVLWCWHYVAKAVSKRANLYVGGATIAGLLWLVAVWGNFLSINSHIEQMIGFSLNDAMKAGPGGILLIFAWSVRDFGKFDRNEPAISSTGTTAIYLLLFVFAAAFHAGAVPDFVYKGF